MVDDNDDNNDGELKIVFADSFFDSLQESGMSDEDQQEFIDIIGEKFKDGSFMEESTKLSEEEVLELVDSGELPEQLLQDLREDNVVDGSISVKKTVH